MAKIIKEHNFKVGDRVKPTLPDEPGYPPHPVSVVHAVHDDGEVTVKIDNNMLTRDGKPMPPSFVKTDPKNIRKVS